MLGPDLPKGWQLPGGNRKVKNNLFRALSIIFCVVALGVSLVTLNRVFFTAPQAETLPVRSVDTEVASKLSEPILIKRSPVALNKILESDAALGFESRVRDGQFIELVTKFRRKSGFLQYYNGKAWKIPSEQAVLQKGYKRSN